MPGEPPVEKAGADSPPIPRDSLSAAEAVLGAFYEQDQRELHLIRGDAEAAGAAEKRANDNMAAAFAAEFPHVEAADATAAAGRFMDALYIQDEIENWEYIADHRSRQAIDDLLFTAEALPRETSQSNDPRWDRVERCLLDVCADAGIDEQYAPLQTRFWKLHGQIDDYWRQDAIEAHRVKLQAMVPAADDDAVDSLAETFVEGVAMHDDWNHQSREEDLQWVKELVTSYYQRVFDLQGREP